MSFIIIGESESESCLSVSDSFWPHGLHSPWNTPRQNTGVGSLSLLQGIFPTRDRTHVSLIAGRFFTSWATREAQYIIIGDWNAKVGSEEIPGVTGKVGLGVQNEAGQRLTEFCQQNSLVIAYTLFRQHKRRLYTWISPDGQYLNQTYYVLCRQWWRSCI